MIPFQNIFVPKRQLLNPNIERLPVIASNPMC